MIKYSLKLNYKLLGRVPTVIYFQFSISILSTTFACWSLHIPKSQGGCSLVYFEERTRAGDSYCPLLFFTASLLESLLS